jgi:hypothetical protein
MTHFSPEAYKTLTADHTKQLITNDANNCDLFEEPQTGN